MELNYFHEFVVLAECCNYLEAADILYISQSSLSKHIKQMEKELGVDLFVRTTRKVSVSEFGKSFLADARKIVEIQEQYTASLNAYKRKHSNSIRIAVCDGGRYSNINHVIRDFMTSHPSVAVDLTANDSAKILLSLQNEECDVAFIHRGFHLPPVFHVEKICSDSLCMICSEANLLAERSSVAFADLATEDFILPPAVNQIRNIVTEMARNTGFEPNHVFSLNQNSVILDFVAMNNGITIMSRMAAEFHTKNLSGVRILDLEPPIDYGIYIAYPQKALESEGTRNFIRYVKKQMT